MAASYPTGRKHCGKRRNCSLRAISPFPTVFSKGLFSRASKGVIVWEWVKQLFIHISALDLQPDDPLVLKRRADVRGKLGKKHAAVSDYKQAIELQGRIEYLNKTA